VEISYKWKQAIKFRKRCAGRRSKTFIAQREISDSHAWIYAVYMVRDTSNASLGAAIPEASKQPTGQ
jgi:hypothetical protein